MKLLLLGKNGQVGWELQRALAPLGHITAHDVDTADFTQPDQVAAIVRAVRPQVIVNAAAQVKDLRLLIDGESTPLRAK